MSDTNLLQFAPQFVALGCALDFDTKSATMSVASIPFGKSTIVQNALTDISKYDDTRNYLDGISSLLLAQTLDKQPNPLPENLRNRILDVIGITNSGKFVAQKLILSLNNHSWHISEQAGKCTYFGTFCVNRGIEPDPERKGKISHRKPTEFHLVDAKGRIKREQLVSPGLKELYKRIPDSNVTRVLPNDPTDLDLRAYSKLPIEEQLQVLARLGLS